MNNRIMETLEILEDRIESIKWLITSPFSLKGSRVSYVINIIKKSAGILGKDSPKGTVFENKVRGDWETNSLKRAS